MCVPVNPEKLAHKTGDLQQSIKLSNTFNKIFFYVLVAHT